MSDAPQHVHGQLREALLALPLAWLPSVGPRERKAAIENVVIAVDSLVSAIVSAKVQSTPNGVCEAGPKTNRPDVGKIIPPDAG
ncbi:MAG: hypothetical protein ACJ8FU_08480 [Xanthobacteraceae bacterium]